MFGWFKRPECRCNYPVTISASCEPQVPLTSPARALELSLTSPDSRDEWAAEIAKYLPAGSYGGWTTYRNAKRDIEITRSYGMGATGVSTPFTLNKAEKDIVLAALSSFDAYNRQKRELAALSRLTASGIEARSDETRSGSAEG